MDSVEREAWLRYIIFFEYVTSIIVDADSASIIENAFFVFVYNVRFNLQLTESV